MKFSEQWLTSWVNPQLTTEELSEQLSLAGLEVDGLTPAAGDFSGVVVAEILAASQHPNADRLQVCEVSDGSETFQVVCGAPNARAGIKVAFAKVGAVLPGNFKIKKAKLRQVESFGMICSEEELELGDDKAGIIELAADAPLGTCLRSYLGLDDHIFDLDLTPNRSDCLSILGVARDLAAINKLEFDPQISEEKQAEIPVSHQEAPQLTLSAPEACPRYLGRIIKGININTPSPLWLQEKLRRSGLRSLDPVVDVTNYVMLELGQPMHAFDLAQIDSGIEIRWAKPNEALTLLDGKEIKLQPSNLVIADASKPLALAGIMGGENSGCNDETKDVLLEVAYFDALSLAGKARDLGLHTDASHRFERGVDFNLQHLAMQRATELLLEIVGGEAGPISEVKSEEHLPKLEAITLRKARLEQLLAHKIDDAEVSQILTSLGLAVTDAGDSFSCLPPSFRYDLRIEEDLVEEIARIYGYDNLPTKAPTAELVINSPSEAQLSLRAIQNSLIARGYQEAITFSFIDAKWATAFNPEITPLALSNPISAELSQMRPSLLPGLAKALAHNQSRQQNRVRFFETGLSFLPQADGSLVQEDYLAGLISGSRYPEGWTSDDQSVDFYDIKGDLEALLELTGQADNWRFASPSNANKEAQELAALHPGQSAFIYFTNAQGEEELAGCLGALHPQLLKQLGLRGPVFVFEVKLALLQQKRLSKFAGVSRFPEMRRDLALTVNAEQEVAAMLATARSNAGEHLQDLTLFDVYQGEGIEAGKKSLALGLTWQHPSRTLTDEEINLLVNQIVSSLSEEYQAVLRS